MTETITTLDVRSRLGDILDRVALRHDQFIIERKGKPLAAVVPVEKLIALDRAARELLLSALERPTSAPTFSQRDADRIAADAKRYARARRRGGRSR